MYWLKICKAWVRSQLRWAWNWLKLNVTSSNVLRIIIHWLSARRDVGLTQGSLIPEEHSLYRALKHSICQHKLNLNLSKTKQPLPIIAETSRKVTNLHAQSCPETSASFHNYFSYAELPWVAVAQPVNPSTQSRLWSDGSHRQVGSNHRKAKIYLSSLKKLKNKSKKSKWSWDISN